MLNNGNSCFPATFLQNLSNSTVFMDAVRRIAPVPDAFRPWYDVLVALTEPITDILTQSQRLQGMFVKLRQILPEELRSHNQAAPADVLDEFHAILQSDSTLKPLYNLLTVTYTTFDCACKSYSMERVNTMPYLPIYLRRVCDGAETYDDDKLLQDYIVKQFNGRPQVRTEQQCSHCKARGAIMAREYVTFPTVLYVVMKRCTFEDGKKVRLNNPLDIDITSGPKIKFADSISKVMGQVVSFAMHVPSTTICATGVETCTETERGHYFATLKCTNGPDTVDDSWIIANDAETFYCGDHLVQRYLATVTDVVIELQPTHWLKKHNLSPDEVYSQRKAVFEAKSWTRHGKVCATSPNYPGTCNQRTSTNSNTQTAS